MESHTLIEPRGGGVNQCTTTTPVENSTPSTTTPVPDTPDTSKSRDIVKRRIPMGALVPSVTVEAYAGAVRCPTAQRSQGRAIGYITRMITVQAGTLVVYSDIGCPWAHAAVSRLHRARTRLGLDEDVQFDHRSFPLELVNERPTPKLTLDAEIPVVGAMEPDAGWQLWKRPDYEYPVSTLLALEAVQLAKDQGLRASELLDRALRVAFFGQSRCISLRHVVLEVASECDGVDVDALVAGLDDGRARQRVLDQFARGCGNDVKGSPHVFSPGLDAHNPGVKMRWDGEKEGGYPVVEDDDPSVYDDLLRASASSSSTRS